MVTTTAMIIISQGELEELMVVIDYSSCRRQSRLALVSSCNQILKHHSCQAELPTRSHWHRPPCSRTDKSWQGSRHSFCWDSASLSGSSSTTGSGKMCFLWKVKNAGGRKSYRLAIAEHLEYMQRLPRRRPVSTNRTRQCFAASRGNTKLQYCYLPVRLEGPGQLASTESINDHISSWRADARHHFCWNLIPIAENSWSSGLVTFFIKKLPASCCRSRPLILKTIGMAGQDCIHCSPTALPCSGSK